MCSIDLRIFDDYPEALAKITEAIAKVYFDNVLHTPDEDISKAYTTAFNICPNYRIILKGKNEFKKYTGLNDVTAEISSLPLPPPNTITT